MMADLTPAAMTISVLWRRIWHHKRRALPHVSPFLVREILQNSQIPAYTTPHVSCEIYQHELGFVLEERNINKYRIRCMQMFSFYAFWIPNDRT